MTSCCVLLLQLATLHQAVKDDLLQHLVGNWQITRKLARSTTESTASASLVLQGHWLCLEMKDRTKPSKYEAQVYITQMKDGTYSIHWLDTFGGTLPEEIGTGTRDGNSICFVWTDADGDLRNTFTWHPKSRSWTSEIVQREKGKDWQTFCVDTYTKPRS